MDAKENALRIVRFDHPERVVTGLPTFECNYFGVNHESLANPAGHEVPIGTQWRDIWGVGWRKELDGVMAFAVEHPLADLAALDASGGLSRYKFPDPDDERLCRRVYQRAQLADEQGRRQSDFLSGSHRETLWERCYNLVGMDHLMMAFTDAPDAVRQLLHRVMDFQMGMAGHYLAVGIDWASLGDDLGSQRGLLFSRAILDEFFVPEYRRLAMLYRQRGVRINFHSCGHIEPIIDVFIDLGVSVLNPVQATANNLDTIRRLSQGRMALQGGVSTHTIMLGPPEKIRAEVRQRLWQLGRDGGYFCAPDQGMPFPPAHKAAFDEALAEYGTYPLRPPG